MADAPQRMNRLASVLNAEDVKVDVLVEDKLTLFVHAALIVERHQWNCALSTVADVLVESERLPSAFLGHGAAVLHVRLERLARAVAAVIRLSEPLDFGAPNSEPVLLFVFLFLPGSAATRQDHEILVQSAEMLSDEATRRRLEQASDASALFATIAGWSSRAAVDVPSP